MTTIPKFAAGNADSKPYWEAAQQGRLVFKKCLACGQIQFPPRHLCPKCWSDRSEWVTSAGTGRVYSYSIVRRAPSPAHAGKVPYVLAVVDLDDAPRMVTNIVGEDALGVKIGDAVKVVFEACDGGAIPQFPRARK